MKYKGKLRGMVGQGIARRRCERAVCVPVLILHFFAHLVFMFACVKCYCGPREMLGNCFLENQISYDTASRMPRCKWPLATKCCQHVPIACRGTAAICDKLAAGFSAPTPRALQHPARRLATDINL